MKKKAAKKNADSEMPKTSPEAMAPAKLERTEEDMDREGQYDLDHLMRAEDIKGDSKRMERVFKAHEKRTTGFKSIEDLKTAYKAKFETPKK